MKLKDFPNLSPLEEELVTNFPKGEPTGSFALPEENDDTKAVRASLLRALLLDQIEEITPDPKGLQLAGARIHGQLDLESCDVSVPIVLFHCRFEEDAALRYATVTSLYLSGSSLKRLDAHRLRCKGPLHLRRGFEASHGVDLAGAHITGELDCDGSNFKNAKGPAIDCDAIRICSDVFLRNGFTATSEVKFRGAAITGQLACEGGTFKNAHGRALNCDAVQIGADVFLGDGFNAEGKLDFARARVKGNLQIRRAQISSAVSLVAARIGEALFLRELTGEVSMMDLKDASAGVLRDDRESWKHVSSYRLQGFRYDRMDSDMRVHERIAWL